MIDPPLHTVGPSEIGDYDEDSIPDLMVKFKRQEAIPLLKVTDNEISITGELLGGLQFEGTDSIILKSNKGQCEKKWGPRQK